MNLSKTGIGLALGLTLVSAPLAFAADGDGMVAFREQMQSMAARLCKGLLGNFVAGKFSGSECCGNSRQILVDNPTRAKIEMSDFGIAHLSFGQSDILPART